MTHVDKRNGTTTLFAALNVLDGTVISCNMQRHRHQEFIRFLNAVEAEVAGKLTSSRHQPLRRGKQCQPQAIRLDRRPQRPTGKQKLESFH